VTWPKPNNKKKPNRQSILKPRRKKRLPYAMATFARALKATLIANAFLEAQIATITEMVSAGLRPRTYTQACKRQMKKAS
jgi:hypothetical protein